MELLDFLDDFQILKYRKKIKNNSTQTQREPDTMSLTKTDIINIVHQELGFTRKHSIELVELTLEIIKSKLVSGEDVLVSGFGKFIVKEKGERKGRNPATGEDLMLRSRRVVKFKCSGKLREQINKG